MLINASISKCWQAVPFHRIAAALLACLLAASAWFSSVSLAQEFPNRPLRIIVPYPPGGSVDALGRIVANGLSKSLGQPVIVQNHPGASGNIGGKMLVDAKPDGYTLMVAATPLVINPSFRDNTPFDVLNNMIGVTLLARQSFVLVVHPSVKATTVSELISLAKSDPKLLTYGSHSAGGGTHIAGELFNTLAGTKILHVPYSGQGPASVNLLGGVNSMMFDSPSTAIPQIKAGKLRGLATTGAQRAPLILNGELPTISETKGFEEYSVLAWQGISAPAGVPKDILNKLSAAINAHVRSSEVTGILNNAGFEVVGTTSDEFQAIIKKELEMFKEVVKKSGAKLE